MIAFSFFAIWLVQRLLVLSFTKYAASSNSYTNFSLMLQYNSSSLLSSDCLLLLVLLFRLNVYISWLRFNALPRARSKKPFRFGRVFDERTKKSAVKHENKNRTRSAYSSYAISFGCFVVRSIVDWYCIQLKWWWIINYVGGNDQQADTWKEKHKKILDYYYFFFLKGQIFSKVLRKMVF